MLDPSRIAAQVVSGIGFLGAGSILLRGDTIRGLTTAASLWTVAAIGLAVGSGLYVEATAATVIILIILAGIKPFETRFQKGRNAYEIELIADRGQMTLDTLNHTLGSQAKRLSRYIAQPSEDGSVDHVSISLRKLSPADAAEIARRLKELPCVRTITKSPVLG
jgi:putative Mg2+ transporter-C (MgtC) family protein